MVATMELLIVQFLTMMVLAINVNTDTENKADFVIYALTIMEDMSVDTVDHTLLVP